MPLPNIVELQNFACSDNLLADVDRYLQLVGERQPGFHELQDFEIIKVLMKAKRQLGDAAYSSNPDLHAAKIAALERIIEHYGPLLLSEDELENEKRRL
jgi:uncharacterized protein YqeY